MKIKQSINYNKYFCILLFNITLFFFFFDFLNYDYYYLPNSNIIKVDNYTCEMIFKSSNLINKINETNLILICSLLFIICFLMIFLIINNLRNILLFYKSRGLYINNTMFINFINFILLFLIIIVINYIVNKTYSIILKGFGKLNMDINHELLLWFIFVIILFFIVINIKKLSSNK